MIQGSRQTWPIALVAAVLLLLAACSAPSPPIGEEPALFSDADFDRATLELALEVVELFFGADEPSDEVVPDELEAALPETLEEELSSQAVLPNVGGFVTYVRHNPNNSNPWQLWRANQANDIRTKVYEGKREIQSAGVSLDGSTLLLAMRRTETSQDFEIYRLNVSSQTPTRLTSTSTPESNVSMSADGRTLVWEGTNAQGRRAVFIRDYSGASFNQRILSASTNQIEPSVSGNGNHVAFIRKLSDGRNRIRLYNKTSNAYQTVFTSTSKLSHPSPSNGGSKVAWLQGSSQVRVKNMSNNTTSTAVSNEGSINHPHLTADGNFLTYARLVSGSWRIFTRNLSAKTTAQTIGASQPINNYAPYWQKSMPASSSPLKALAVANGLTRPTYITHAGDGSGRLFVTTLGGQIVIIDGGRLLSQPFLDISSLVGSGGSMGLYSMAFHPNYKTNGFFYVYYLNTAGNSVIARYRVSTSNPNVASPGSASTIITIVQPNNNHYGGQLQFGPDGYLYTAMGDGGPQGDPYNRSQDLTNLHGAMLRINVSSLPYTIPADNPFVNNSRARDEIWAYGLRNPWRFSFDRLTGDLFIGDVGYLTKEEINFQPANSRGGENYGWRLMEGSTCFNPATNCNNGSLTLPIIEYDTGENCSVTGGYRYRGRQLGDLYGTYVYGDFCSGRIWGATPGSGGRWTSRELLGTGYRIVTFGEDEEGELYIADYAGGGIYRITR